MPEVGLEEKREQVAKQYEVVAHLATALASVHTQSVLAIRSGALDSLLDQQGSRSASIMEDLGDILNGMDAVDDDEDSWTAPIFSAAQKMFSQRGID